MIDKSNIRPSLVRLESGLMVPMEAAAATPREERDEAAQPQSAPQNLPLTGVTRSKQQAILDAPEQVDPTTMRVLLSPSTYSFRFNRKTGVVQVYNEPREVRRKKKLEERRAAKKARKGVAPEPAR